jgi:hypothetical protein
MIDPLELEFELVRAEDALHKAAALLARYNEEQALTGDSALDIRPEGGEQVMGYNGGDPGE